MIQGKEFVGFLIVGAMAAAVNFSSRVLYSLWLDFSAAIVFAYISGMIVAFVLAKSFVFTASKNRIHHSIMYFILVNLLSLSTTWATSISLAYYVLPFLGVVEHVKEIAHGVGLAIPAFLSYYGHKSFTFR